MIQIKLQCRLSLYDMHLRHIAKTLLLIGYNYSRDKVISLIIMMRNFARNIRRSIQLGYILILWMSRVIIINGCALTQRTMIRISFLHMSCSDVIILYSGFMVDINMNVRVYYVRRTVITLGYI